MKKLFICLAVLFSSCSTVYVPNVRNSPLFTKGGEFQASVQAGNGLDAQAAVAVSNHIGLMANFSYINRESEDQDDFMRHKFFEGGIGYYTNKDNTAFEVFAGYGQGEGSSYYNYQFFNNTVVQATGKYRRYFIQPSFGVNKKVMHFGFAPRFSIVDFTEFGDETSVVSVNESPVVFFEPAFIGKVNALENKFFFTFQLGLSWPTEEIYYDHRFLQTSIGFGLRLGSINYLEGK